MTLSTAELGTVKNGAMNMLLVGYTVEDVLGQWPELTEAQLQEWAWDALPTSALRDLGWI